MNAVISRRLAVLACTALATSAAAPARAEVPPSAEQQIGATVGTQGRGADQAANPDYLARVLPDVVAYVAGTDTTSATLDPYRKAWGKTRGVVQAIGYRNRYGAKISGHLWRPHLPWRDPVTGVTPRKPLPVLMMLSGLGADEQQYWGLVESLAESGYAVMTFDPQGQGASDVDPSPKGTYCDPKGAWRQPQELGLRESGSCAGYYDGIPPTHGHLGALADATAAIPVAGSPFGLAAFVEDEYFDRAGSNEFTRKVYDLTAQNFVFGAFDAVAWLRSSNNPWRKLIDLKRVGLMGHSLGAYGALIAANGDPKRRFAAAVTYDSYGTPPGTFKPTVPTMTQMAESSEIPGVGPKSQEDHPSELASGRVRNAGVDEMNVAIGGSTHQEWSYVPLQLADPVAGLSVNASSKGERIGAYYAQAWFDRFLKGRDLKHSAFEAAQRADAVRRLTAQTFDGSVDRSSIGQGTYDAPTNSNVPYKIAGESVAAKLSKLLRSQYSFDGHTCADMIRGC